MGQIAVHYKLDMKAVCDFYRLSLEDEAAKHSNNIEYHELDDDSSVSIGQFDDQHPNKIQS